MTLIIIAASVAVIVLLNAWRLDRRAAARGLTYVPVKQKGWVRNRTRLVLVDRDEAQDLQAEKLHNEQLQARDHYRGQDLWRLIPGARRRPRG